MLLREFENLCRLDLVTHHRDELRLVTGGLRASQNGARLRVLGNRSKQTLFFFGLEDDLNLHRQATVSGTNVVCWQMLISFSACGKRSW